MVDIRQVAANNIYLTQLAEAQDKLGDSLIKSIDSEVTLPLRIRSSASLVVHVDSIKVTNPEHSRNKTIAPVSNILPNFIGGTITLPALGSGNITNSTGSPSIPLNLSISNYIKVGVNINTSGQIIPSLGTMHSGASEFGYMPPIPSGCRAAGHFVVYCDGSGNVQNVQNSAIWQYAYAISAGGEGAVFERVGTIITSGPYTVTQEDCIIRINTTSSLANVVVNLPSAVSTQSGRKLIVKDIGGKVSVLNKGIVLTPNGSDTIEGETSIKMDMDKMSLTLICGGNGTWMII